jgi:hypothetical protein
MTATQDLETISSGQDLPAELLRYATSMHQTEEPHVARMLSGIIATHNRDDVICPLMLRRNLVVPAHQGLINRSAWRVA